MSLKFFLIDDDADDRDLFREALYTVDPRIICHTAMDGRKALFLLNSGGIACPDIIFLDINMPGMTGWECLAVLKSAEPFMSIPVVMYSTSSYAEDIEKAQADGALCFYTKPSRFPELIKSLEIVVQHLKDQTLSSLANTSDHFVTAAAK